MDEDEILKFSSLLLKKRERDEDEDRTVNSSKFVSFSHSLTRAKGAFKYINTARGRARYHHHRRRGVPKSGENKEKTEAL
jgi:hypothetical protein